MADVHPDRGAYRLLHVFPTFALGGAQVRMAELANSFGSGWQHIVVSLDRRSGAELLLDPHVPCALHPLELTAGGRLSLANLRSLLGLMRELKPHLLLTYNWGAIEAALARRLRPALPHLHFEDGFGPEEAGGHQLRRRVWTRRLALAGKSQVVVPSRTLERIALEVWRLSPKIVHHIPNGIACARFAQAAPAPELALRRHADEIVIGTVCMLRPEKNLGRLLRLFARLPSAPALRLAIVGDGAERRRLEDQAAALGIADRVTFTGAVRAPEGAYPHFDIFALTSDTEQMPYGVVEAMAAGLPLVATDVGDVRLMVPEPNRRLVIPAADDDRLVAALAELIHSPELRQACGRRNQEHALATFSRETMLERYRALFAGLLVGGARSDAGRALRTAPSS